MGRVSGPHIISHSILMKPFFSRLKPAARRSHLGPTGKKKASAPQKKSMKRREIMFENAREATTARGIPLVLAESSETVRKQTLEWVSRARFKFFHYSIPLTGFKTGFFRQGVVSSQPQPYQWQFKWNAKWNAGR
jgi:hypothetical protein